ncbi:MAG: GatB/YqeY domain-containing protein [Gemmatimonadota bacterium]
MHPLEDPLETKLRDEIRDALNRARKDRDRARTVVLSTALSDIRNREIEEGGEADDEMVRMVLARAIKQRQDSAEQMRSGQRDELADKEESEAAILQEFLPPAMDEAEVRRIVRELIDDGPAEMGPIMGKLMPRIRGRFDGKDANRIVREELAG